MPFRLVRDDITRMRVDAIVNAANTELMAGGGVCGAIFRAAGARELQAACDEIGHVDVGDAVATPGFALPARWVIHTAGPVWHGGKSGEREALASCYARSLELAAELGAASVAFPLISSGIYGYPREEALQVATEGIASFLAEGHDLDVALVVFDQGAHAIARDLYDDVAAYIDDAYARNQYLAYPEERRNRLDWEAELLFGASAPEPADMSAPAPAASGSASMSRPPAAHMVESEKPCAPPVSDDLTRMLDNLDASFPETLLALIDERGLKDSDVYHRANLSRQYFSKLRAGSINPSKQVVLALAVALELPLDDCRRLLERAGYALTHTSKRDIIVEYFVSRGSYDIFEINGALFSFDQPLLGAG